MNEETEKAIRMMLAAINDRNQDLNACRKGLLEDTETLQRELIRYEAENQALKRALDRNIIVNVYSDHVGYENPFQGPENASEDHSLAEGDPLFEEYQFEKPKNVTD